MAKKEERTLEQVFTELEEVIVAMEGPDVSLEDSFMLYHKGMDLLKSGSDKIDRIEKKMLVLDEEGDTHGFEQ